MKRLSWVVFSPHLDVLRLLARLVDLLHGSRATAAQEISFLRILTAIKHPGAPWMDAGRPS